MVKAVYYGPAVQLQGKSALIRVQDGKLLAQFDDTSLYEAFGWHEYSLDCFCTPELLVRLLELLNKHRHYHSKVGCPGRPECSVCAEEEWFQLHAGM